MADQESQDPTAPVNLMVQITDGSGNVIGEISLADYLKQADDALAQASTIPGEATVTVSDGSGGTRTMTGDQYMAMVEQDQQTAHANTNKYLDSFTSKLNLSVTTFSGLAGHLQDHASAIGKLLADMQTSMRGIHHGIGNDDTSNTFRKHFDEHYGNLQTNMGTLKDSCSNIHDGLNTSADNTFTCEKNTLAGFGRQAVDPRTQPGGGH